MRKCVPSHLASYCCEEDNDKVFVQLRDKYEDEFSYVYKVKCKCGCKEFTVYRDNHPSIFAECSNCKEWITIYDLKYYTCAVKLRKEYVAKKIFDDKVSVYVCYEYSDELYELEPVDENDVTWGMVFVELNNEILTILNDETA